MGQSNLAEQPSVADVFKYISRHPLEIVFRRWNWKAAVLSGVMRSSIYFATHIALGWKAALSAMSVEFLFRTFNTGIVASISQSFRRARPRWLATLCVMVMLPAYGHTIEFLLHTLNGDQNLKRSIVFSITFSVLSAVFNLYAMRRGVLLVKDSEQRPFWNDIRHLPRIAFEFVSYPFRWIWRKVR